MIRINHSMYTFIFAVKNGIVYVIDLFRDTFGTYTYEEYLARYGFDDHLDIRHSISTVIYMSNIFTQILLLCRRIFRIFINGSGNVQFAAGAVLANHNTPNPYRPMGTNVRKYD